MAEEALHEAKRKVSHAPDDVVKSLEHAGHNAEEKVKHAVDL